MAEETRKMTASVQIPSSLEELPRHRNAGFDRFMQALGDGLLKPGVTLTQAQLCSLLDLSISPLRETLVLLEEYGLIEIKPRSVTIPGSEAMERAAAWRQARKDLKAAKAICEAQEHWFAANGGDAELLTLDEGKPIKRTQVDLKGYTKKIPPSRYWKWSV